MEKSIFQIATLPEKKLRTDVLVITLDQKFVKTRKKTFERFPEYIAKYLKEYLEFKDFKGSFKETALFYLPKESSIKRIFLIGTGDIGIPSPEDFRSIGYLISEMQEKTSSNRVHIFQGQAEYCSEETIEAICEGILFQRYSFKNYKSESKKEKKNMQFVCTCSKEQYTPRYNWTQNSTRCVMQGVFLARDLANEPSNNMTPAILKDRVLSEFKDAQNIKTEIFDQKWLEKNNFNALLSVSKGSREAPYLISLKYSPKEKARKRLLLVGKGVTFDSGGISIKPSAGMEEMKYDMAGAAAVIGTMKSISLLEPKLEVAALVPAVENMPGGSASKPGDIIKAYNGKTVEIINTDAEGRLILADALAYGIEQYEPDAVIDLATLTGACIVSLGDKMAGLFSNSDVLANALLESAAPSGDRLWRLPLDKLYEKDIESEFADIKNLGSRWGGAIHAAKFLENFTGKVKWAHIDMAGPANDVKNIDYLGKGAAGYGPRLICKALKSLEKVL